MKKAIKKSLCLLFVMMVALSCLSMQVFAKSSLQDDPYKVILNEINKEYDLDLGYVIVDPEKITIDEYEKMSRELAEQQRNLLDHIASRKNSSVEDFAALETNPISPRQTRDIVTVTRTEASWYDSQINLTLTYDHNSANNWILNERNPKIAVAPLAFLAGKSIVVQSGPTYVRLDGGRTTGLRYIVSVYYSSTGVTYQNVNQYAEFGGR